MSRVGAGAASGVDARRYTWSWTQAVWSFGAVLPMLAEDVDGAEESGSLGLLRYVSRLVGEYCVTAVYLVMACPRPLPPTAVRPIVALAAIEDGPLRTLLTDLLRGAEDDLASLAAACREAITQTIQIIGPVPDLIGTDSRYRALGQARDWLRLITAVGEGDGDYLPRPTASGRRAGAPDTEDEEGRPS